MAWEVQGTWRDLFGTFGQSRLRWIAWTVAMATMFAVVGEVIAGVMELKGQISPNTASWFRVSKDWSLGEIAGYFELQIAAIFLFLAGWHLHSPLHLSFAAITEYLLIDDALELHERAGKVIGPRYFEGAERVRPQDYGELAYLIFVILTALLLLFFAYRVATLTQRRWCLLLVAPFVFIALASVGLDLVHALIPQDQRLLGGAVAVLEDGSELLGFGLLLLVAAAQWRSVRRKVNLPAVKSIGRSVAVTPSAST
jgi:hypothetical protein